MPVVRTSWCPQLVIATLVIAGVTAICASPGLGRVASAPDIRGTWKGGATAGGTFYPATWIVTSESLSTGHFTAHVAGNPAYTMSGTVSDGSWRDTNGTGNYVSTEHGTLTVKNGIMTAAGTFSDSNGVSGTWKLTHAATEPTITAKIVVPELTGETVPNGRVLNVMQRNDGVLTLSVTARGGDFKDVFVKPPGLVVTCGKRVVKVFALPPEASGFPLADGQTRTFRARFLGVRGGSATVRVDVRAVTADDQTDHATARALITVGWEPIGQLAKPVVRDPGAHQCGALAANPSRPADDGR